MRFRPGDQVVYNHDLTDPNDVHAGVVKRVTKEQEIEVVTLTSGERVFAYCCWPESTAEELKQILAKRHALKEALDASMSLVYQLRNKITRGGD